ncbi:hypothetical protein [Gordonia iterans]
MTEQQTSADDETTIDEDAVEHEDTIDEQVDDEQESEAPEDKGNGNREAAKLRHQRNQARTERDELAARLEAVETKLLGHALATANLDPRLWEVSDQNLDDYRDDDGHLNLTALTERAHAIKSELGLTGPRPNPQQGLPGAPPRGTLEAAFDYRQQGR